MHISHQKFRFIMQINRALAEFQCQYPQTPNFSRWNRTLKYPTLPFLQHHSGALGDSFLSAKMFSLFLFVDIFYIL